MHGIPVYTFQFCPLVVSILDPSELELWVAVSYMTWVLQTKLDILNKQ